MTQATALVERRATQSVGGWLFPFLLLATLLQNYYDISAILSGQPLALYQYDGPIFFKILKDLSYLAVCISVAFWSIKLNRFPLDGIATTIYLCIGITATASLLINNVSTVVIGLRWAFPFLIFFALGDWARYFDKSRIVAWLIMGLAVCLTAQLYQLFNMPPIYGEILPGVPARTPGIFLAPNSTAFFACASLACVMSCVSRRRALLVVASTMALSICLLTQSGTGIVVCLVLIAWLLASKSRVLFFVIALIVVGFVFPNLNNLTMREDYIALSGGGRLDVLFNIVRAEAFSLGNFGVYTNAFNLLSQDPRSMVAVDSLVASWVGNFGLFSPFMVLLVWLFVRYSIPDIDYRQAAPCLIVLALFSLTTIVFEAFPMNLYLAFGIWLSRRNLTHQFLDQSRFR